MITGLRKADMILLEPFASYMHWLFQSLISSPSWIIVGYGATDTHVNSCLSRAWQIRCNANQTTKVVVVDYLNDETAKNDEVVWAAIQRRISALLWPHHEEIKAFSQLSKRTRTELSSRMVESREKVQIGWLRDNLVTFSFEGIEEFCRNSETTIKWLMM